VTNYTPAELAEMLKGEATIDATVNCYEMPANPAKFERSDTPGGYEGNSLFNSIVTQFCANWKLSAPTFEYRFHNQRRWRFDAAIPEIMVAIELEGGQWVSGRHNRPGQGYEGDIEKYNTAALMGWFVLRFTTDMMSDGRMLATLEMLPPF